MNKLVRNRDIRDIWIIVVHVKDRDGFGHLENKGGAYVKILVKAKNIEEMKFLAKKVLFEEGFVIVEIFEGREGGIELLSDRLKTATVDRDILSLVEVISETYPVQFGDFHSYPKEDLLKLVKKDKSDS